MKFVINFHPDERNLSAFFIENGLLLDARQLHFRTFNINFITLRQKFVELDINYKFDRIFEVFMKTNNQKKEVLLILFK